MEYGNSDYEISKYKKETGIVFFYNGKLVKVGCFISAGSALEEWTEKKKGKYLIMQKDADSNVFFPYDIFEQINILSN